MSSSYAREQQQTMTMTQVSRRSQELSTRMFYQLGSSSSTNFIFQQKSGGGYSQERKLRMKRNVLHDIRTAYQRGKIGFLNHLLLATCLFCCQFIPILSVCDSNVLFLNHQLASVFHQKCTKTIIYEAFGGSGSGDVFLFGNFCSSFLSFFG